MIQNHYKTKEDFNEAKNGESFDDSSIYFIEETNEIYTHDKFYKRYEWDIIKDPKVGDVVLVNNKTLKKITVKPDKLEKYKNTHTPIGIVVIPASHNIYGTEECGVISLKYMRCDTPDEGGDKQYIGWGQEDVNTELPNLYNVANYGSMDGDIQDALQSPISDGSLPTDFNTGKESKTEGLKYCDSTYSSNGYIPSPYLTDGSRNPDYYDTTISTKANAMADFNGKENTEKLCELVTKQSDWRTDSTITDSSGSGYSPAACCCWRYHTLGTNQGDWYLPACGELGYAVTRKNTIDRTVTAINKIWSSSTVSLYEYTHWSSSEHSSPYARSVGFNVGVIYSPRKSYGYYVRAFMRL